MKKNEDRKLAESVFLKERGRVTNKELAPQLNVRPATVARWRKLDEWDVKLVRTVSVPAQAPSEEGFQETDLRHLGLLNERIDNYLVRRDLVPAEIRDLAEAKYHIMSCMQIIQDYLEYPAGEGYERETT